MHMDGQSWQAILVEDEAALRLATSQTLELGGFDVQACASAEEAVPLLRADYPGVLVTDVRLPGRSGLELLAQVGALDAELRCWVTEDERRRVQCPHCHAHTVARVAVGATADCAGCGRSLLVYHHVSRRHGAYLGFMADAEEPGG